MANTKEFAADSLPRTVHTVGAAAPASSYVAVQMATAKWPSLTNFSSPVYAANRMTTAANDPSDAADTLTKLPAAPVTPPADMELHVDLLILPPIEKYEGTVEYGISSGRVRHTRGLASWCTR